MSDTSQPIHPDIARQLGEISAELRALLRQNSEIKATGQNTQTMVQNLTAELAAQRATIKFVESKVDRNAEDIIDIRARVNGVEVENAKRGALFGAASGLGMAIIAEMVKQWIKGGG